MSSTPLHAALGKKFTLPSGIIAPVKGADETEIMSFLASDANHGGAPTVKRASGDFTNFTATEIAQITGAVLVRNNNVYEVASIATTDTSDDTLVLTAEAKLADEPLSAGVTANPIQGLLARKLSDAPGRNLERLMLSAIMTASGALDVDIILHGYDGTNYFQVAQSDRTFSLHPVGADSLDVAAVIEDLGVWTLLFVEFDVTTGASFAGTAEASAVN